MKLVDNPHVVLCPSEHGYLSRGPDPTWLRWRDPEELIGAGAFPLEEANRLAISVEWPHGRRHMTVRPTNMCPCCGLHAFEARLKRISGPHWRCDRHVGRNPCVIDGCGRTRDGKRPGNEVYICGSHWRLVPPHMKRAYQRIFRLERKSGGWTDMLIHRHWRVWARIVRAVREAHAGGGGAAMDMGEIEKMFG